MRYRYAVLFHDDRCAGTFQRPAYGRVGLLRQHRYVAYDDLACYGACYHHYGCGAPIALNAVVGGREALSALDIKFGIVVALVHDLHAEAFERRDGHLDIWRRDGTVDNDRRVALGSWQCYEQPCYELRRKRPVDHDAAAAQRTAHLDRQFAASVAHLDAERPQGRCDHRHGAVRERTLAANRNRLVVQRRNRCEQTCGETRLARMQLVGAGSEPSVDSQCIVIDYVYVCTQCLDALYGRLRVAAHLYAAQRRASLGVTSPFNTFPNGTELSIYRITLWFGLALPAPYAVAVRPSRVPFAARCEARSSCRGKPFLPFRRWQDPLPYPF